MRLADGTDEHFGKLDVLVNAAALAFRGSIVDTDLELWNAIMDVNLRAPFFLTQRAIAIMRRENIQGSIVNIGSVSSHGSIPRLAPYAISKGALVSFTRNVAHAMTRDRIRVNTLNIGWMDTPGEAETQRRFHSADESWLLEAEAAMPSGRLLRPSEVASAVLFLASEDSGMMTSSIRGWSAPGNHRSSPRKTFPGERQTRDLRRSAARVYPRGGRLTHAAGAQCFGRAQVPPVRLSPP